MSMDMTTQLLRLHRCQARLSFLSSRCFYVLGTGAAGGASSLSTSKASPPLYSTCVALPRKSTTGKYSGSRRFRRLTSAPKLDLFFFSLRTPGASCEFIRLDLPPNRTSSHISVRVIGNSTRPCPEQTCTGSARYRVGNPSWQAEKKRLTRHGPWSSRQRRLRFGIEGPI